MSQKSKSVTGGFGERVLDRVVARDTFLPAEVRAVVFSEVVEYRSGGIDSISVTHTSPLSVYERWEDGDNRDVRSTGVAPSLFLKVYVKEIQQTLLIEMEASEIVQFGEFTSLNGSFKLTQTDVEVKVDAESVEFEEYGTFSRADDVTDTRTYQSFVSDTGFGRVFDKSHRCGRTVEARMREEWARNEGVHSGLCEIEEVDDSKYSKRVMLEVSTDSLYRNLEFSLTMDDWDDNPSLRKLIDEVGNGLVENLEMEKVWVSMDEYSNVEPVAESGAWKLYAPSDRPNVVSRFVSRFV